MLNCFMFHQLITSDLMYEHKLVPTLNTLSTNNVIFFPFCTISAGLCGEFKEIIVQTTVAIQSEHVISTDNYVYA